MPFECDLLMVGGRVVTLGYGVEMYDRRGFPGTGSDPRPAGARRDYSGARGDHSGARGDHSGARGDDPRPLPGRRGLCTSRRTDIRRGAQTSNDIGGCAGQPLGKGAL